MLQHVQTPMVIVKGANHFMDGEHEFDLLEHTSNPWNPPSSPCHDEMA